MTPGLGTFLATLILPAKVDRPCLRCFPDKKLAEIEVQLVSPRGVVHEGEEYGRTVCGRDATGPGWWWKL